LLFEGEVLTVLEIGWLNDLLVGLVLLLVERVTFFKLLVMGTDVESAVVLEGVEVFLSWLQHAF
jgi:hypothetical protein